MISFEDFVPAAGSPIYLQLLQYIKRGIVSGSVADGDELPSRRMLSALLGINPGTAQRIYRLLEEEGLIVSVGGSGSHMALSPEKTERVRRELVEGEIKDFIVKLKQSGLSLREAEGLLEDLWKEDEL